MWIMDVGIIQVWIISGISIQNVCKNMRTYKICLHISNFPLSLPLYIYIDLSIDRRTVIYANDSGCTSDICIYKYVCVYSYTYNYVIAFTKHIISG